MARAGAEARVGAETCFPPQYGMDRLGAKKLGYRAGAQAKAGLEAQAKVGVEG